MCQGGKKGCIIPTEEVQWDWGPNCSPGLFKAVGAGAPKKNSRKEKKNLQTPLDPQTGVTRHTKDAKLLR